MVARIIIVMARDQYQLLILGVLLLPFPVESGVPMAFSLIVFEKSNEARRKGKHSQRKETRESYVLTFVVCMHECVLKYLHVVYLFLCLLLSQYSHAI